MAIEITTFFFFKTLIYKAIAKKTIAIIFAIKISLTIFHIVAPIAINKLPNPIKAVPIIVR